jgi:hypothetical protein
MAVDDIVRLDLVGTVSGHEIITSHHFGYLDALSNDADLIDTWQTAGETLWRALFPSTYTFAEIRATQVWPGPLDSLRGPTTESPNVAGTSTQFAGQQTPVWFAQEVTQGTARRGRRRQGRFFVWVPNEAAFNGDTLDGGQVSAVSAYRDALFAAFGLGGTDGLYEWVVFSRTSAYIPGEHPPRFDLTASVDDVSAVVTSVATSTRLTTQRGRRG